MPGGARQRPRRGARGAVHRAAGAERRASTSDGERRAPRPPRGTVPRGRGAGQGRDGDDPGEAKENRGARREVIGGRTKQGAERSTAGIRRLTGREGAS
jgi:hypothetical protein